MMNASKKLEIVFFSFYACLWAVAGYMWYISGYYSDDEPKQEPDYTIHLLLGVMGIWGVALAMVLIAHLLTSLTRLRAVVAILFIGLVATYIIACIKVYSPVAEFPPNTAVLPESVTWHVNRLLLLHGVLVVATCAVCCSAMTSGRQCCKRNYSRLEEEQGEEEKKKEEKKESNDGKNGLILRKSLLPTYGNSTHRPTRIPDLLYADKTAASWISRLATANIRPLWNGESLNIPQKENEEEYEEEEEMEMKNNEKKPDE